MNSPFYLFYIKFIFLFLVLVVASFTLSSNSHIETIKYLMNIYLFIYLKYWSTSRYTMFDVILCRLSMSFINCNSGVVKWRGYVKCHIVLSSHGEKIGDGRYIATGLNICCWTFSSPTNALVEFIKTRLKLGRLLQHVSVYKETIIREPVSA